MREIKERSRTLTWEEHKAILDQRYDVETERWQIMLEMLIGEAARFDSSDRLKAQRLAGPKTTTKSAQLILDRAAEPSHGLTPDDLKMVKKAVFQVASTMEKGKTCMKVGGFALSAGFLYYVYTTLNWSL